MCLYPKHCFHIIGIILRRLCSLYCFVKCIAQPQITMQSWAMTSKNRFVTYIVELTVQFLGHYMNYICKNELGIIYKSLLLIKFIFLQRISCKVYISVIQRRWRKYLNKLNEVNKKSNKQEKYWKRNGELRIIHHESSGFVYLRTFSRAVGNCYLRFGNIRDYGSERWLKIWAFCI